MDADLIKVIDSRFAQMVITVYLDGAIELAQKLGINRFVMVAPGKDLVNAVTCSRDGWYYKKLTDGDIYVGSKALQQLVVARGIEKMLPWIQNRVNPRVVAGFRNGRIYADINRTLLLCAGDVESNPGPPPVEVIECEFYNPEDLTAGMSPCCIDACNIGKTYGLMIFTPVKSNLKFYPDMSSCCMEAFWKGMWFELYKRVFLQLGGDIESNPGPVFVFAAIVAVIINTCYNQVQHLDFHNFQHLCQQVGLSNLLNLVLSCVESTRTVIGFGIDWAVGEWLDNAAYDCAWQRHSNEQWSKLYDVWFVGGLLQTFSVYFPSIVPSFGELQRETIQCRILAKVWTIPYHMIDLGVYDYFVYGLWCCVVSSCCGGFIFLFVIYRYVTHGVRKVRVVNGQKAFIINDLKDDFMRFSKRVPVKHQNGRHLLLAAQRRMCEEWCFSTLLSRFDRVRDIGGSRSRFVELGYQKHVCGPVINNDDILREEKSRGQFENCGQRGEFCPLRNKIPAAIMSHVDYHMTVRQITQCVSGPTFIINHDFNRHSDGVGKYLDENGDIAYEAVVTKFGSRVSMVPDGGTPYLNHPFHNWMAEGSVVSPDGAFTYVRLGDFGETSVYYCHPSDGLYSVNDPNALTTKSYGTLPNICGYHVSVDHEFGIYKFIHTTNMVEKVLPMDVVDKVAIAMASCIRDEKYPDTLRSYLNGKMVASGIDEGLIEIAFGLVSYLSDLHAVKTIPFATCIMGHPVNFKWSDIVKCRILIWLSYFRGTVGESIRNRILDNRVLRRLAPWMFNTIHVPSYEAFTKRAVTQFGSGIVGRFNRSQFPTETTSVVPSVAGCGQYGPRENAGQCVNINGNTRVERRTETITSPNPSISTESTIYLDACSDGGASSVVSEDLGLATAPQGSNQCNGGSRSKSPSRRKNGKSEVGSRRESCSLFSDCDLSLPGGEREIIIEPVLSPGTVVSCHIIEGFVDSFTIDTYLKTSHNFKFEKNVSIALRGNQVDIEKLCQAVTGLLRHIEGRGPLRIEYGKILQWAVRLVADPHGRSSDKSVVPQGYGLLPLVSPTPVPPGFTAYGVGPVGFAISNGASTSVDESPRKGAPFGYKSKGRPGKVFSKNRDQC